MEGERESSMRKRGSTRVGDLELKHEPAAPACST